MVPGPAPADELGTTSLPDGRRLAWARWGPPTGAPVLFFSGAAMGRSLGFGVDVVDRLGVRLVAVDRPGIGGSDPSPGRTLSSWADDVRSLVAALGLEDVRLVGFSQGAVFALVSAAAGVGERVALVSGQDDLAHPPVTALLDDEVAGLVAAVAAEPDEVEATFAATGNAASMWRLVTETSSALDADLYTAEPFAAAYQAALDEGFAQGGAGAARDFVLAVGAWPFPLADVRVPVDLWYGAHDASPVHSPDHGELLARRLPDGHRHLLPDAGGSILWTHAEAILTTLLG